MAKNHYYRWIRYLYILEIILSNDHLQSQIHLDQTGINSTCFMSDDTHHLMKYRQSNSVELLDCSARITIHRHLIQFDCIW